MTDSRRTPAGTVAEDLQATYRAGFEDGRADIDKQRVLAREEGYRAALENGNRTQVKAVALVACTFVISLAGVLGYLIHQSRKPVMPMKCTPIMLPGPEPINSAGTTGLETNMLICRPPEGYVLH